MSDWYILGPHNTPIKSTVEEYCAWEKKETSRRVVKKTKINDDIRISTVFLGLDHSWNGGEPDLFETMVFRYGNGEEMGRCSTWKDAERMHKRFVEEVEEELLK